MIQATYEVFSARKLLGWEGGQRYGPWILLHLYCISILHARTLSPQSSAYKKDVQLKTYIVTLTHTALLPGLTFLLLTAFLHPSFHLDHVQFSSLSLPAKCLLSILCWKAEANCDAFISFIAGLSSACCQLPPFITASFHLCDFLLILTLQQVVFISINSGGLHSYHCHFSPVSLVAIFLVIRDSSLYELTFISTTNFHPHHHKLSSISSLAYIHHMDGFHPHHHQLIYLPP
jgi:hypothetical protein